MQRMVLRSTNTGIIEGSLQRMQLASIQVRAGQLATDIITKMSGLRTELQTTYRIYQHSLRIDVINELHKEASPEAQACWFAFSLDSWSSILL